MPALCCHCHCCGSERTGHESDRFGRIGVRNIEFGGDGRLDEEVVCREVRRGEGQKKVEDGTVYILESAYSTLPKHSELFAQIGDLYDIPICETCSGLALIFSAYYFFGRP